MLSIRRVGTGTEMLTITSLPLGGLDEREPRCTEPGPDPGSPRSVRGARKTMAEIIPVDPPHRLDPAHGADDGEVFT
jgi:hypothetical protein